MATRTLDKVRVPKYIMVTSATLPLEISWGGFVTTCLRHRRVLPKHASGRGLCCPTIPQALLCPVTPPCPITLQWFVMLHHTPSPVSSHYTVCNALLCSIGMYRKPCCALSCSVSSSDLPRDAVPQALCFPAKQRLRHYFAQSPLHTVLLASITVAALSHHNMPHAVLCCIVPQAMLFPITPYLEALLCNVTLYPSHYFAQSHYGQCSCAV